MNQKFGKKYPRELMEIKQDFYLSNDILLKETERINTIYVQQPLRKTCKMCGKILGGGENKKFESHGVSYYYCEHCHHLNGAHEETEAFCKAVYVEEDYGKSYYENDRQDFQKRAKVVYLPKMEFLLEQLKQEGLEKEKIHILDVGAGSGYFVQTGLMQGIDISG